MSELWCRKEEEKEQKLQVQLHIAVMQIAQSPAIEREDPNFSSLLLCISTTSFSPALMWDCVEPLQRTKLSENVLLVG